MKILSFPLGILFYCAEGPMIDYHNGVLRISDLNPEAEIKFRISRAEILKIGLRAIIAAMRG